MYIVLHLDKNAQFIVLIGGTSVYLCITYVNIQYDSFKQSIFVIF